jgi:CRISPR-associated endonuclease/helicase Cas3
MVVLILESVPVSLRGELSKWMLEPKAGVFVGTLSGAVRDLIWEKACRELGEGGCTMIYRAANEQGFAIRSFGDTTRQIDEWEGLFLVRRPAPQSEAAAPPAAPDWQAMLHPEVWAKSPSRESGGRFHPLICHMIDTAMVALRLWQYGLNPALKERIRAALGVDTMAEAGQWVAFIAGLHDLGKATPPFAKQDEQAWERLHKAGYKAARYPDKKPHQMLSAYLLRPLLEKMGLSETLAKQVAMVAGGHHGLFPSDADLEKLLGYEGTDQWETARSNLLRVLAHVLHVDQLPLLTQDLENEKGVLLILAGLTSVADWIASDETLFPYAGDEVGLPRYPRRARWLAWKALHRLGWFQRPSAQEPRRFQELFDKVPNRLQEQVMALAPQLHGPSLVLLEYPMGGGKTEAALYLADYLAAMAGQTGAYFALPTMATANQMFGRVGTYLRNRFPDGRTNVQLLHGHADLYAEFIRLKELAQRPVPSAGRRRPAEPGEDLVAPGGVAGGKGAALLAAEWFTYRKRGLLAPYGIGTVDQALLAVLQTKHFFVRLFGLAGKVVIFDEIHAYDTYMQTLFAHLLTWLAACGTSVVLLSATLPAGTRAALLDAYAAGRGRSLGPGPTPVAYPRLSWVDDEGSAAWQIDGAPSRTVQLQDCDQTSVDWVIALKEQLSDGGCAAVIVNTVTRAQRLYQALQEHFPQDELFLFHARYPFDERMQRETSVLTRFGPGSADRPRRAVVVATQVIEQSLDLDFDLMVSDVAPIDLLFQRSGRVWRHPGRERPPGLAGPTLWVLNPRPDEAGCPVFERGSVRVYDAHTLLRTWLALSGRTTLTIPADLEALVEMVYREEEPPTALPEALRRLWEETAAKLDRGERTARQKAERRYIPGPQESLFGMGMAPLDEEDGTLHEAHQALTRLGGLSVSVVCLTEEGGQLWASAPDEPPRTVRRERRPSPDELRALLGRSLRISFNPGLVRLILAEPIPAGWEGSAHLRRHRALRFTPEGNCLNANLPLRLDPELGLVDESHREEEEM